MDLSGSSTIHSDSLVVLLEGIRDSDTLKHVNLSGCPFSEPAAQALASLLDSNSSLHDLVLRGAYFVCVFRSFTFHHWVVLSSGVESWCLLITIAFIAQHSGFSHVLMTLPTALWCFCGVFPIPTNLRVCAS